MKFLFIIDPIASLDIKTDSSLLMMLEAQKRKKEVYYCEIQDLSLRGPDPVARVKKINIKKQNPHWKILSQKHLELQTFDVIFMRKDPPVDEGYIYATYVLDLVKDKTRVLNDPTSLRSFNEKLIPLYFQSLIPSTLISSSLEKIKEFQLSLKRDIILKPLYGFGGLNVFRCSLNDKNLGSLVGMLTMNETFPVVVQEFLPEIEKTGDKRILIVNGEPIGAVLRRPQRQDIRANLHAGGSCSKTSLNKQDLEICSHISSFLIEKNIFFAGIDVIGNKLIEVNITSPTCMQELNRLNHMQSEIIFMNAIESLA
ncbi:MAG: glutathione synthase [Deltaproteobacteria bacterium]|nr:glutathione synthase [Deltaproteobacteria bacterium]